VGALRRLSAALVLAAAPAFAAEPVPAPAPAIVADARLDLVGLLQRLSGDPSATRNPESDAAVLRFAPWKDHPAVKDLARMRAAGFAWDAPAQYAVYLSSLPALSEARPAPDFFATLAGGRAALDAWRAELADFARVSDFPAWERERAPRREAELAAVRASADGDLAAPLAAFLGARTWDSWTVAVSPFFPPGGGASWILEEKPGRPDVVVVYGPSWTRRSAWRRSRPVADEPRAFAAGAWPEAAFSMTYAVYEACRPVLKPSPSVCLGMQGLTNAEDCVQQHWVRGIVARLIASRYGAAAAKSYREHWPPTAYQAGVDAALAAYEGDRSRYKDLMDAADLLSAPFQPDGRAPACRAVDPSRWRETVYARRLAYYLDARLEARPDADLEKVRAELAAFRAGGAK